MLHLASSVSVFNRSSVPFAVSIGKERPKSIGICKAHNEQTKRTVLKTVDAVAIKPSNRFSIPFIYFFEHFVKVVSEIVFQLLLDIRFHSFVERGE